MTAPAPLMMAPLMMAALVCGCSKGANLIQNGAGVGTCIGCSGGYGGLYCFAVN